VRSVLQQRVCQGFPSFLQNVNLGWAGRSRLPLIRGDREEKDIEKAHRKGKIGWHVGAKIEVIPNVRWVGLSCSAWCIPNLQGSGYQGRKFY
jgi:hypothetical protein